MYGIGIGPGDPELLTLKAKRIIENCDVVFAPRKSEDDESTALNIVRGAADLTGKEIMLPVFGMTRDPKKFLEFGNVAADMIVSLLSDGKNVTFITLGDVSVYSTYYYLHRYVVAKGFESELVPGIPSFCAGAAMTGRPLVLGKEGLAVVPSIGDESMLSGALDSFDNIVVMKSGNNISKLASMLKERNIDPSDAMVISNVGMAGEYIGPMDAEREYGYFTTVLIRKSG